MYDVSVSRSDDVTLVRFRLSDVVSYGQRDSTVDVLLSISSHGFFVNLNGYGNCSMQEGHGDIAVGELYDGIFRILCWQDINREETTEVVNFERSKEEYRKA